MKIADYKIINGNYICIKKVRYGYLVSANKASDPIGTYPFFMKCYRTKDVAKQEFDKICAILSLDETV